jgi:hypothetical protein
MLLSTVLVLATAVARQSCPDVETGVDLNGNDCCGGKQTLNSTVACCGACQQKASVGCRFWTYDADLKHCYLKSSNAGKRKSSGHVSGSAQGPSPPPPTPATPAPGPAGAGAWRWPFAPSPYVVASNPRDGLPDFSLEGAANYTSTTISCPLTMQRDCCGLSHGDESCGASTCTTRPCDNGVYCANFANAKKFNTTQ